MGTFYIFKRLTPRETVSFPRGCQFLPMLPEFLPVL